MVLNSQEAANFPTQKIIVITVSIIAAVVIMVLIGYWKIRKQRHLLPGINENQMYLDPFEEPIFYENIGNYIKPEPPIYAEIQENPNDDGYTRAELRPLPENSYLRPVPYIESSYEIIPVRAVLLENQHYQSST
jgi:hypothetical protein